MRNKKKSFLDIFVDTEKLNSRATQKERETSTQKRSLFLERYQYFPVYIFGLLLYWLVVPVLENFLNDDDIFVYALFCSVPLVLLITLLKNKIRNKWVFHSLLALLGAPFWILLLSPLILMFLAFTLF